LSDIKGKIEFKNVQFAYNDDDWVLRDISLTIEPGTSVALVGATGAGKSSIISLLLRYYDIQSGEILIDGVDIRKVRMQDIRKNIAVVLQDVFLFSGTIEENIRLGNREITDEQIRWAARQVNAHHFIENLEGKYQAEVKERGATFSVGQKQLLAFARALAFNPRILILDEATSSIDTETEQLIQEALARLMEHRTSIVIAHRLSTIQHVDKIIVLHKGKIREMGNHQDLLDQRGLYYKLYQLQYKEQELKAAS
jgi:ABC-type multidrug transport system fused ATPase/permease subunit